MRPRDVLIILAIGITFVLLAVWNISTSDYKRGPSPGVSFPNPVVTEP